MFWRKNVEVEQLKNDIKFLEKGITGLKVEKSNLKEELEDLKLKKRLEQEEIIHLKKIDSEKKDIEIERKKSELEKTFNERISKFREEQTADLLKLNKELHGKLESRFNVEIGNLKDIYKALMDRLPNVTLALEKKL